MYRGNSSRVFPVIVILIIVAVAIAALVSAGKAIFGGGEQPVSQTQVDASKETLKKTTVGNSVRMTVRGPIVADENFRSYQVNVDSSGRNLTTYSGYLEQQLGTNQFGNNVKAYEQFVYALDRANLMAGTALTGDKDDTRGICATGNVYEFEVVQSGMVVKRLWTSTCKGSPGSFKGSVEQVKSLFLNQIPDNKKLLKNIDL